MKHILFFTIKSIITTLMILIYTNTSAQNITKHEGFDSFYNSLNTNFKYPNQLAKRCIPIFTMMFVQFKSNGDIDHIKFSDSAFPQFVNEIFRIKDKLDFKSVYKDIVKIDASNNSVLIPIHIGIQYINSCKSVILPNDRLNLLHFSGEELEGNINIYPEVYIKNYVGRVHYD
ncbi:hypothetical protein ACR777_08725 [Sphingobacterium spiritivorum]|uniref:hypothetical protein n=2 Tax=Sphingobacterium spiritivorum TaxID=258 RepID=UPI003DA3BC51